MVKVYKQLMGVHGACILWEVWEQVQNRMAHVQVV